MANEFKVRKGLIVQGSGSNIFDVQGSQGQLFSITDSLSGSLFSVNDISGIPIMEVFSDNTIKMGTFNQEAIIISGSRTGMGTALPQAKLHISGASNSGLFEIDSPAVNNIIYVSGSGNVGIGTATPGVTLDVSGNIRSNGSVFSSTTQTQNITINSAAQLQFRNTSSVEVGRFDNAGNWGIGATSPTSRLQVRGSGATSATTALRVENSSAAARLTILDDGTSAFNTSHLYISSSGNIGIGLTSPLAKLHISGANSLRMQNTGFDTFEWFFSAGTGIGFRNVTDGTTPFFVGGTDDIGIGTTNTSARLHISGASNAGLFEIDSPAVNNIIYVSGSGNVGIGTNLPSADLHISGASADSLLRVGSPSNASILFVTGSGRVGINTTSSAGFLGGNISTFTIFQNSGSGDGLTPSTGLQIVNSGSSTSAQAQLSIVTVGDKFAAFNIGTSGSGTQNNYWHLSKRNAAASHSLNLYNNNQGSFSSPLFSFISAGTSTLGENGQIQIDGANGLVGIQTTPSEWIHLSSDPASSKYLRIDATQTSNGPQQTPVPGTFNYVAGPGTDDAVLGLPNYWMEIKLDGNIVLVPCYVPQ